MGHRKWAAFLGSTTFCCVLLAGCTSGSGVVTQSPEPSAISSVAPTSPVVVTPSSTAPASSSTQPASTPATPATTDPWPADLTPDQIAAAQAALVSFDGYIQVLAEANAEPTAKDWTADIRRYAADPLAAQALAALTSFVTEQVRQTVPPTYEHPTVISVYDHKVVVEACLDNTKTTLVDASDTSVLSPPANPRSVVTLTLYLYAPADGGWLVSEQNISSPVRPC